MVMHVDVDVQQLWRDYRAEPTVELRNQLVEHFLPLVKYNAERIWARLPEGVDLRLGDLLVDGKRFPRPRLRGGLCNLESHCSAVPGAML